MNDEKLVHFSDVLASINEESPRAWVYLPKDKNWTLQSSSAVLESDEVPPELEDQPDAGVPEFAKRNGLVQVVPVTTLQDIVANAKSQSPNVSLDDLFKAFEYYYKHDAFVVLR
jgi:hypothetical protein